MGATTLLCSPAGDDGVTCSGVNDGARVGPDVHLLGLCITSKTLLEADQEPSQLGWLASNRLAPKISCAFMSSSTFFWNLRLRGCLNKEIYTLIAVHYTHGGAQANPKVVVLPVGATVAHAVAELQANVCSRVATPRPSTTERSSGIPLGLTAATDRRESTA